MIRKVFALANNQYHLTFLNIFAIIVLAHWLEHIWQMRQIYSLEVPRHCALGLLGMWYPWLVSSEWLHFGYALIMLGGLVVLRYGFYDSGLAYRWWMLSLVIQVWHMFEHTLLFIQAQGGFTLFGADVPTSVIQTMFPSMRAELHFIYNALATFPMVVAMVLYYLYRRNKNY